MFKFRIVLGLLALTGKCFAASSLVWNSPTGICITSPGGSGIWNTSNFNWCSGAASTNWVNGDDAFFPGGSGTVTLNATINFNTLNFTASGYTIDANSPFFFNETAATTINSSLGATNNTIAAQIVASSDLTLATLSGTGTLTLSNDNNTIGGSTYVEGVTLIVPNFGKITNTNDTYVGNLVGKSKLTIEGTTQTNYGLIESTNSYIGYTSNSSLNTVDLNGGVLHSSDSCYVGYDSNNNTLTTENGGGPSCKNLVIGYSSGTQQNQVTLTDIGSIVASNSITVGYGGTNNSLSVLSGLVNSCDTLNNSTAYIGYQNTATYNTAEVSGLSSSWLQCGSFYLGYNGSNNSLSILNQGTVNVSSNNVNDGDFLVGFGPTPNGDSNNNTLTVSGSGSALTIGTLTSGHNIYIGGNSAGSGNGSNNTMLISQGGEVTAENGSIGDNTGSHDNSVTVTDAGSLWSLSNNLYVGKAGLNNSLTVVDGGEVTAGGSIILANNAGSSGTLFIGTGGAPGTVTAASLSGGSGTGTVIFNHNANPYTFSPPMSGNLTVEQVGTGTTVLTGASTFAGNTQITNGTLQAGATNALSPNSTVNIQSPGILNLGGFNQTTLDVTNDGTLTFGGSPNVTLQVNGAYTQGSGATLIDFINPAGATDLINATGPVSLNGTLSIENLGSGIPLKKYHLIHSNSSVSGTFSLVNFNTLIKPVIIYDPMDVYLLFGSNLTGVKGLTPNQREVAAQWDALNSTSPDALYVLSVLINLPTDEVPRALDDMAGEQYTYLTQLDRYSNEAFSRRIFNALRISCVDPCDPTYGWLQVTGGQYFVQKDINSPGLNTANFDVSLGIFSIIRERLYLGVGANYELNRLHFHQGGKPYWNTLQGSVYGAFMGDDSYFFADIIVGRSWGHFTRPIDFSTIHRQAKSNPSLTQAMGYAELGCNFCLFLLDIQPFIGAEYGHYSQNRFTEHGADSLNLRLRTRTTNTADSYVGAHISSDYRRLSFNLDLAWQHRFKHANILTKAQFDQFGTPFPIQGVRLGNEGFVGALGCLFSATECLDLYAQVSGECWQRFYSYAANVGFNLQF